MKLKSHITFAAYFTIFALLMYFFAPVALPGLVVVGVLIYVVRFLYDRRQKSKPKPKKEERVCCKRCSGEEPWPGEA